MTTAPIADAERLPRDPPDGTRPVAWWGTALFIATEAMLFGVLFSSYFFIRFNAPEWPLGGIEPPALGIPALNTAILLSSSLAAHAAGRVLEAGSRRRARALLGLTMLLGLAFLALQAFEYSQETMTPGVNAYASLFFTITGFHGLHVAVGLALLGAVFLRVLRPGRVTPRLPLRLATMYWHFVDAVWIFVFGFLYVLENLS